MRPFQWHLKENWTFPQSLDKLLPWSDSITPGLVAESTKCSQRCRSPPPRTQRSSVYRCLKRRLGRSLKSRFYQRTVVRSRKIIAHKRFRTKGSVLFPKTLQASMPGSTVLVAADNWTVVAYINKQDGTHSVEMCALLWRIMSWCHRFKISLRARHIPGCLNVIVDSLSRSTQIHSTEFAQIGSHHKWICLPLG